MGISFSSLKYCCCGDLDSDSDSETEEKINNLQFEELQKGLRYYLIYRECL